MHWGIHISKLPFVGWDLPVGMHVPLAQHEHELLFGVVGVNHGQGYAVEAEVPGGVPGILPLIGHGEHVGVIDVLPVVVASVKTLARRCRAGRIALEPAFDYIVVKLLRPKQPSQRLPHHPAAIFGNLRRENGAVKLISLGDALRKYLAEVGPQGCGRVI